MALVPVMEMLLIAKSSPPPVFLTVTAAEVVVVPSVALIVREVGESVTAGATELAKEFTKLATFSEPRPVARSYPALAD
jgi:hypothetical protein